MVKLVECGGDDRIAAQRWQPGLPLCQDASAMFAARIRHKTNVAYVESATGGQFICCMKLSAAMALLRLGSGERK